MNEKEKIDILQSALLHLFHIMNNLYYDKTKELSGFPTKDIEAFWWDITHVALQLDALNRGEDINEKNV